jgi:hypothetical protein
MKASRKSPSRAPAQPTPLPLSFSEVDQYGTITDPRVCAPATRADVFENISARSICSTDQLIDEVEACSPLACHFFGLADARLSKI